jgi:hypothetical protein
VGGVFDFGGADSRQPPTLGDVQHSTRASATTCRRCHAAILNAWDEGLLVRVAPEAADGAVAAALVGMWPVRIFAFTPGGHLVAYTLDRVGCFPRATFHVRHECGGN